jgi:hypothetical protein
LFIVLLSCAFQLQAADEAAKVQQMTAQQQQVMAERQQLLAEREKRAQDYQHLKQKYAHKSAALKEVSRMLPAVCCSAFMAQSVL